MATEAAFFDTAGAGKAQPIQSDIKVRAPNRESLASAQYDPTRYLTSSAFILKRRHARDILRLLGEKTRAVAPEPGLDMDLLLRVYNFVAKRETIYQVFFALLSLPIISAIIEALDTGSDQAAGAIIVSLLPSMALYLFKRLRDRFFYLPLFAADTYSAESVRKEKCFRKAPGNVLKNAIPSKEQNVVVYKCFTPFVGAGVNLGGWSFTTDVSRPKEQVGTALKPVPFNIRELYSVIDSSVNSLGFRGLTNSDFLYVHGTDLRKDRIFLPELYGRPVQQVDQSIVEDHRGISDCRIRHYKWIRVHDWNDELILSYFLRCSRQGNILFVETTRFLLTPLADEYRKVDVLLARNLRESLATMFYESVFIGPLYALCSQFMLFAKLIEGMQSERQKRRLIKENPLFNYGVDQSIRERYSSKSFDHYFQKLDGRMYLQVLEKDILDATITFLDEHNINTSDIKERQTAILNTGVIVQGGDLNAQSLAVGTGSQAVVAQTSHNPAKTGRTL